MDIKKPRLLFPRDGANYWRRPTFAQPIEALSSGLQRFTSVFGMGTGGATALGSPESSGEIDQVVSNWRTFLRQQDELRRTLTTTFGARAVRFSA